MSTTMSLRAFGRALSGSILRSAWSLAFRWNFSSAQTGRNSRKRQRFDWADTGGGRRVFLFSLPSLFSFVTNSTKFSNFTIFDSHHLFSVLLSEYCSCLGLKLLSVIPCGGANAPLCTTLLRLTYRAGGGLGAWFCADRSRSRAARQDEGFGATPR